MGRCNEKYLLWGGRKGNRLRRREGGVEGYQG